MVKTLKLLENMKDKREAKMETSVEKLPMTLKRE